MEFELSIKDLSSPAVCPILGIPIISGRGKGSGCSDFSPSIDRIDNSRGYTRDNIAVISYRANRLKSDATIEELELILAWMKTHENHRRHSEGAQDFDIDDEERKHKDDVPGVFCFAEE